MRHNEHSSPNAPNSSLSLSFSVISPQQCQHLEVPLLFSHDKVALASYQRTPTCKSSQRGRAHPYQLWPTLSQRHFEIHSIASLRQRAALHPKGSRQSVQPHGKRSRMQIRHLEVEIVRCRARTDACLGTAGKKSRKACQARAICGTQYG